jgi:hypothetical protein
MDWLQETLRQPEGLLQLRHADMDVRAPSEAIIFSKTITAATFGF